MKDSLARRRRSFALKRFPFLFLPIMALFLSCASKQEFKGGEDPAGMYAASHSAESVYLRCNAFSDDTFQGIVAVEEGLNDDRACALVNIVHFPANFFESDKLFLQAYPFAEKRRKLSYGPSLDIEIYDRNERSLLITTKIIDLFLIERKLQKDKKSFFEDHYFQFCGADPEWEGMQLVIYLRKDEGKSTPLRITKFLLPPFLAHPRHFQEEKGDILAAFHPFLSLGGGSDMPQPETYYEEAKEFCEGDPLDY